MNFTLPMALFDFIPVVLYVLAIAKFISYFRIRMKAGMLAAYCGGTFFVAVAGALKALWKLLYALGVCDFQAFNTQFMTNQAIGFVLTGIAMISFVLYKNEKGEKLFAVPVITSSMPFVIAMCLGLVATQTSYCVMAARKKKWGAVALFLVSLVGNLGMGYLSSRDFAQASMNWIAEGLNFVAMLCLYLGAKQVTKAD